MDSFKVIAAFRFRGEVITPPRDWTPPNESVAKKLVAAKCLQPIITHKNTKKGRRQA